MVVISFKTPLILAFVAHNVACVTVKILPERPDESTGEKILEEFKIQVVHGGYFGKKTELPVRRELTIRDPMPEEERKILRES